MLGLHHDEHYLGKATKLLLTPCVLTWLTVQHGGTESTSFLREVPPLMCVELATFVWDDLHADINIIVKIRFYDQRLLWRDGVFFLLTHYICANVKDAFLLILGALIIYSN